MEVTVTYNHNQLEAAVNFIAENNAAFRNRHVYIRKNIRDGIREIGKKFPNLHSIGSMGYILIASSHEEGIDQDRNAVHIEIYVDPGLMLDYEPDVEEDIYIPPKE